MFIQAFDKMSTHIVAWYEEFVRGYACTDDTDFRQLHLLYANLEDVAYKLRLHVIRLTA